MPASAVRYRSCFLALLRAAVTPVLLTVTAESRPTQITGSDPPPPRIVALLAEQALYANIGGPAVMAGQLEHLMELAQMPRITIQVIPNQSHPGLLGAFMIAETDQRPDLVYLETTMGGQVLESYSAAERIAVLFDTLRGEALTVSASLDLIKEAAQRWQDRITP